MSRLLSWLWQHWRFLLVLALLVGATGLALPQLQAWYHWRAAQSAMARYHSDEARKQLDDCLQSRLRVWPTDWQLHLLASRAARRSGDFADAEQHLLHCEHLEGTRSQDTILEAALLRAASGDLQTVEEFLQARAQKQPAQAPLIWEALAEGCLRMYRVFDALACLERWQTLEPENPQVYFLRGNIYRQLQIPAKTVPEYRRVVELDPERNEARYGLALGLLETGHFEEALTHFEHLHQRQPNDVEVQVRLARCHSRLGQQKQARQILDAVLAEHPNHGMALRTMGEIAQLNGQLPEAEEWFRKATIAVPDDYTASYTLFQILNQEQKTAEAQAQKARAEELKDRKERISDITTHKMSTQPHDPALQTELGTLLLSLGHKEVGASWLLSALRENEHFQPAHAALAKYYEEQGETEKAAFHREQAQAEGPPPPKP